MFGDDRPLHFYVHIGNGLDRNLRTLRHHVRRSERHLVEDDTVKTIGREVEDRQPQQLAAHSLHLFGLLLRQWSIGRADHTLHVRAAETGSVAPMLESIHQRAIMAAMIMISLVERHACLTDVP